MKLKHCFGHTFLTLALLVGGFAMAAPTDTSLAVTSQSFRPSQVKQIQTIVHDYLLKNPEIMVEVMRTLQQKQRAQMETRAISAIHANSKRLFHSPTSPVFGNSKGNVTLVEFFDYQCPHCKTMVSAVEDVLEHAKNVKVVYKEFPIFPGSMYASQAALAAQQQGKYLAFHKALMADKNPLSKPDILRLARKIGLNIPQLEKGMKSKAIRKELQNNVKLAQDIGLVGTPAFILQNNKIKNKTFFVPGQVSSQVLLKLVKKAS